MVAVVSRERTVALGLSLGVGGLAEDKVQLRIAEPKPMFQGTPVPLKFSTRSGQGPSLRP